MSKVRLTGATSGFTEITAPATAGNNTIMLPSGNGSANQLLKNGATAGSLEFASNVVIDSSGRLLVGTSTALNGEKIISIENAGVYRFTAAATGSFLNLNKSRSATTGVNTIVQNNDTIGTLQFLGADGTAYTSAALIRAEVDGTPGANDMPGRLVFSTTADGASSPTERMRINNAGNVSIGTAASSARLELVAGNQVGMTATNTSTDDLIRVKGNAGGSSGSSVFVMPMRFGDDTLRGSIFWNGSTVAYNTTSDYRLKENVTPYAGAIGKLSQLKPVTYNFLDKPDTILEGFIAHEVQDVVPNAVSGVKDEVDSEGNPFYQGLDTSKLVPLLTAALQEALQQIEALTARVTALEAN